MAILRRDFWSTELRGLAIEHGIDGFVSVQARQSLAETDALLKLAETESLIRGVVGWVDFASDAAAEQLESYAGKKKLKGLRHVVQDEPDDNFILGQAFNRGIKLLHGRDLVYDILIFARQLAPAIKFAQQHDEIPMVLDHIAKPTIKRSESASKQADPTWRAHMNQLAALPNVGCKFSGVATEVVGATPDDQDWDVDNIRPYWDAALEAFSPSRLMFGSDWPVCLLKTSYGRWLEAVRELASELSENEQYEFFAGTAKRLYHLE